MYTCTVLSGTQWCTKHVYTRYCTGYKTISGCTCQPCFTDVELTENDLGLSGFMILECMSSTLKRLHMSEVREDVVCIFKSKGILVDGEGKEAGREGGGERGG